MAGIDLPIMTSSTSTLTSTSLAAFGPLITPFVPPTYCATALANCAERVTSGIDSCWLELGRDCDPLGSSTYASACYPGGTEPLPVYASTYSQILYSPATACPAGWTAWTGWGDGEVTVQCCPTGFTTGVAVSGSISESSCLSYFDYESSTLIVQSCRSGNTPSLYTATTSRKNNLVWIKLIQIVLGTADASATLSDASSSPLPATASTTPTTDSSSPPTGDPTRKGSASSLAPGAIAGIVIGAVAAILLLVAALFFFRRRRRRHTALDTSPPSSSSLPELNTAKGERGSATTSGPEMRLSHPNDGFDYGTPELR
ncbi:hypothetical protein BDW02DRAFT_634689 [Decorospora gaudefroyi]|uniref:Mid2 domain-containing protein n=1 Tax=Decorospora gaudefroyi TaxID=184978 RepID=A0A6A5JXW2_9PLEO|nr:hypothetical protein BDW02DRAFT_634689 [Decorospora gaudefroyi]